MTPSIKYSEVKTSADDDMVHVFAVAAKPESAANPRRLKKPRSWLAIACSVILLVLVVSTILLVATGWFLWNKVVQQVERFTVTTPVYFPIVDVPSAELDVVKDQASLFVNRLRLGEVPEDWTLTERQMNGFIGQFEYLRGNAAVTVDQNKISFYSSLPVGLLPGGKGRYFVSSGSIDMTAPNKVSVHWDTQETVPGLNGPLLAAELLMHFDDMEDVKKWSVNLDSGTEAFGMVVPPEMIAQKANLLEPFYDNGLVLNGIERIAVDHDKIVVYARTRTKEIASYAFKDMVDMVAVEQTVSKDMADMVAAEQTVSNSSLIYI
jgi:hypothetical protein